MVQQLTPETKPEIIYPDSDGEPIADNTKQFRWIVTIKENLVNTTNPTQSIPLSPVSRLSVPIRDA